MIPKIIHYCWFGGNPLPESAKKCIASWRKFFPNYEIKEWNESNFDVNSIKYTREAYKLKKYAFVSDYARMWILYNYGGLYFDTDVEIIKPMDDIIARGNFMGFELFDEQQPHNFKTICGYLVNPGLGIGMSPSSNIIKEVLEWYQSHHFVTEKGRISGTIVYIVTNCLSKYPIENKTNNFIKIDNLYIYSPDFFSPKNYYTGVLTLTSNTRSIHHYSATWVSNKTLLTKIKERLSYIMIHFKK